jgi:hypothetical protein
VTPLARLPLLALGFVALVAGTAAGLARLGVAVPHAAAAWHGPLMICGFFGTVIALERAVAVGGLWPYTGPLAAAAGTIAVLVGAADAPWLFVAAGAALLAASVDVLRRQAALFTLTLAAGAACWLVGSALWASGTAVFAVVAWWLAFLVLTIAGERLELSRLMPPSPVAVRVFAAIAVIIVVGAATARYAWGVNAFGAGLVALAAWLGKQDVARRTVRTQGLTRFIAVCLLSGYVWLAVGGIVIAAAGLVPGSPSYDAALHALGLGFVFSMVFGHAPIIFPAVLRVAVPYHRTFYVPLALLHLSLFVRLAGDATASIASTRIGGLGNALALAAFVIGTATAITRGRRRTAVSAEA